MKKIQTLNVKQLRTEEDFGFQKFVRTEIANLPEAEPATPFGMALANFNTAFEAFDAALKISAVNSAVTTATVADEARDLSWRAANAYAKAMSAHPDSTLAAYGQEVKAIFDKYGDPTKLPQTEESGVLHNLLQDLQTLESARRTAIGLDAWITDLQSKEDAFLAAAAQRTEKEAARQVGIVKESRTAADAAYRSLVNMVNALAIIGGEETYSTFIDHVNVMIDHQKAILKARKTNNAKTGEE